MRKRRYAPMPEAFSSGALRRCLVSKLLDAL